MRQLEDEAKQKRERLTKGKQKMNDKINKIEKDGMVERASRRLVLTILRALNLVRMRSYSPTSKRHFSHFKMANLYRHSSPISVESAAIGAVVVMEYGNGLIS